jgi:aminoglycoside 6'-N-acetyltransferase I
MIRVRPVTPADAADWLRLRRGLWPADPEAEQRAEIRRFFARESAEPQEVLIARSESGEAVGMVELSIHAYAEGCVTDRVAYLEGWFVVPEARRSGVGRALVAAAEEWGRAQQCSEFASDTTPDNQVSIASHRALGFEDAGLIRCFRKDL